MAPGKQCCVCDKRVLTYHRPRAWPVAIVAPFFTLSVLLLFQMLVLKFWLLSKRFVPYPGCEARLRSLPAKLEEVEKNLDDFVSRVEVKFSELRGSLPSVRRNCSPDVDKAVEAVSAMNNRDHVIICGLAESGSSNVDIATVKDVIFVLDENGVKAVDLFWLGKTESFKGLKNCIMF